MRPTKDSRHLLFLTKRHKVYKRYPYLAYNYQRRYSSFLFHGQHQLIMMYQKFVWGRYTGYETTISTQLKAHRGRYEDIDRRTGQMNKR